MTGWVAVALDVGSAMTRLALSGPGGAPVVASRPTPGTGLAVFLSKLLEAGRAKAPGAISGMTVTVPEAWLDGTAEGVRAYERLRRTVLEELGWPRVTWLGQAACVAAEALHRGPARRPDAGPVLVCDLGARTVGAALCDTGGRTLRVTSVAVAEGGGTAFDTAVAASYTGPPPAAGFSALFDGARTRHGRRAAVVLPRAWTHPRYREAPVYRIGDTDITAGTLITAFSSTAATLKDVVARALSGAAPPATIAVAGRFGVFPLVSRVLLDELSPPEPPLVLGPAAAVRGALRIASGGLSVAEPARPAVTLPLYRIKHGLMEVREVPLDPSADFAVQDGYPMLVEVTGTTAPFDVRVDGRDVTVRPPDLPPGPYRVGLRPSHARPGVLVLAPAAGGEPCHCPIDPPMDREAR
ncbi:hypothetical protein AGRA3207_003425 [Actinomadura graeca]|uniref:Hsp70 family protein n=1 Tax=Actinomadura graeca TaxID=2750812 RepID=A0ABX8QW72_9ACTN|nr:hypothetical protein [Actinomadura graeca]QXJ22429.1 hypothetical protein AGRA3207_003425 [Actinomadura graeca]